MVLKRTASWLASIGFALGLAQGNVLIAPDLAIAGPDLATDVVAPYVHLPTSISPGAGPLTTVFWIRSPKPVPSGHHQVLQSVLQVRGAIQPERVAPESLDLPSCAGVDVRPPRPLQQP